MARDLRRDSQLRSAAFAVGMGIITVLVGLAVAGLEKRTRVVAAPKTE